MMKGDEDMKRRITAFIDWFEERFSFLIELLALIGGIASIILSLFVFVVMVFFPNWELPLEYVFLPGLLGFLGVAILIALRLARHFTKDQKDK